MYANPSNLESNNIISTSILRVKSRLEIQYGLSVHALTLVNGLIIYLYYLSSL